MVERRVIETRPDTRKTILLRAVILTPMAILILSLLAVVITSLPGSFFGVAILALCGIPAAIEARAAIRDLRAAPIVTQGRIDRLWHKFRFMFFGRVNYMLVDRRLFEVGRAAAVELLEGDEVVIEHWPHTNTVISLARPPHTQR